MSKKPNTVNVQARAAVVAAYTQALQAQATTGNLIRLVCESVNKAFGKTPMTENDRDAIVTEIAAVKGWEGPAAKVRMSEVKTVLAVHNTLPEAITAYTNANNGKCQWHDGMKLARRLNGGQSAADAVAAMLADPESKSADPSKRVLSALKLFVKAEPHKAAQAVAAAKLLGLELKLSTPKAVKPVKIAATTDDKAVLMSQFRDMAAKLGLTLQ